MPYLTNGIRPLRAPGADRAGAGVSRPGRAGLARRPPRPAGAGDRRARHRQGIDRRAPALPVRALGPAAGQAERGGDPGDPARERAVRPRGRRLHRRRPPPRRPLRARARRQPVPGRDRQHQPGRPGAPAAGGRVWQLRPGRRQCPRPGRRPADRRHQRRSAGGRRRRPVPARPPRPARVRRADRAAPARAAGRHPAAGRELRAPDGARAWAGPFSGLRPGRAPGARGPPLAGQRARAQERGRARGLPGRLGAAADRRAAVRSVRLALPTGRARASRAGDRGPAGASRPTSGPRSQASSASS